MKFVNTFWSNLPQRHSHVESSDFRIRQEVSDVSAAFQDVMSRTKKLSGWFLSVTDFCLSRQYTEAVDQARTWLRDAEPKTSKICGERVAAELKTIQEQLDRAKDLRNEIVLQGRLFDVTRQVIFSLILSTT